MYRYGVICQLPRTQGYHLTMERSSTRDTSSELYVLGARHAYSICFIRNDRSALFEITAIWKQCDTQSELESLITDINDQFI